MKFYEMIPVLADIASDVLEDPGVFRQATPSDLFEALDMAYTIGVFAASEAKRRKLDVVPPSQVFTRQQCEQFPASALGVEYLGELCWLEDVSAANDEGAA